MAPTRGMIGNVILFVLAMPLRFWFLIQGAWRIFRHEPENFSS